MMITDADDFFTKGCGRCDKFDTPECSTRRWIDGLNHLRAICLDMGLSEQVKWAHPCYMDGDRNIALFGAFRDNFRLSFMNASLLKDPHNILQSIGPNSRSRTILKFTSTEDVATQEPIIREYLAELIGYAEAGLKPAPRHHDELVLTDALIEALDSDPDYAEAFHDLTPGRKRGWMLHFDGGKQRATRDNRVAKARDKILSGKGWNER